MNNNKILIPIAIIIAALVIGGVMYWIMAPKNDQVGGENVSSNNPTQEGMLPFAAPGFPSKVDPQYDYILGNPDADIFIVEYSDLECPFCKVYHSMVVDPLSETYVSEEKVAFVYRQFPISSPLAITNLHPSALEEAKATECVGQIAGDDKFYEFVSLIFQLTKSDGKFNTAALPGIVEEFGVDKEKWQACMNDPQTFAKIENSFKEAVNAGVSGTPTVFVVSKNGEATRIPGQSLTKEVVEKVIMEFLK